MNHDTKQSALPALTADLLRGSGCLVDNLFANLWKEVGMTALRTRIEFQKRSGTPVNEVMFCLMLWVWLKATSVSMFARESMNTFSAAHRDAMYAALNREDWNWRRLHLEIARKAVRLMCSASSTKANVFRRVGRQGYRLPTRHRNAWAQKHAHPIPRRLRRGGLLGYTRFVRKNEPQNFSC